MRPLEFTFRQSVLRIALVAVTANLAAEVQAQEVKEDWRAQLLANHMVLDRHNNLFLDSNSGGPGRDIYVTKLDPSGNTLWVRSHGDLVHSESSRWLAVDSRGDVIVTGHRSWARGGPGGFFTVKFDNAGNLLWSDLIETNGEGYRVEVDASDNIYVTGKNYDIQRGFHFFTFKYDPAGNLLWQRPKNLTQPKALAVAHGRVAVVGSTGSDMGIVVYDLDGNELFSDVYPSAQGAEDVVIGADGSVYMCGTAIGLNALLVCYDASGNRAWWHHEPGPHGTFGRFKRLAIDGADNIVAVGYGDSLTAYQDWLVTKVDALGNKLWSKGHDGFAGNEEWALAVHVGPKDEVYVAGLAGVPGDFGTRALGTALIRYDAAGNIDWLYEAPRSGHNPSAVILDSFGEVVVDGGIAGGTVIRALQREWTTLGSGLAGTNGLPDLAVRGYLEPMAAQSLAVTDALPSTAGVYLFGLSRVDLPFFGGTLVPFPDLAVPFQADASGRHAKSFAMPGFIPVGTEFYVQSWLLDPGAVVGLAATDAVLKVLQ